MRRRDPVRPVRHQRLSAHRAAVAAVRAVRGAAERYTFWGFIVFIGLVHGPEPAVPAVRAVQHAAGRALGHRADFPAAVPVDLRRDEHQGAERRRWSPRRRLRVLLQYLGLPLRPRAVPATGEAAEPDSGHMAASVLGTRVYIGPFRTVVGRMRVARLHSGAGRLRPGHADRRGGSAAPPPSRNAPAPRARGPRPGADGPPAAPAAAHGHASRARAAEPPTGACPCRRQRRARTAHPRPCAGGRFSCASLIVALSVRKDQSRRSVRRATVKLATQRLEDDALAIAAVAVAVHPFSLLQVWLRVVALRCRDTRPQCQEEKHQ